MTKTLEISTQLQAEINRRLWIQALRKNGGRQIKTGLFYSGRNVCAAGLAMEMAGTPRRNCHPDNYRKFLGVKHGRISVDNDCHRWTFAQIADAAEQGRYWPIKAQSVG